MTEYRRCTGKGSCGQTKPLDAEHFRARKDVPGGMYSICRACEAARAAGRRSGLGAVPRAPITDDEVTDGRPVAPPTPPAAPKPPAEPREPNAIVREHRRAAELERTKTELRRLAAELHTAQERQRVLDAFARFSAPPIVRREVASGMREATAVVLVSDLHVEEPVEAEKVNGLNEYSLAIADRRIDRLAEGILWLLDMHGTRFAIRDLVLWLGGDLFSGHIHDELVETSELHPIECVLWLQERIIRTISTLLASTSLERIVVPCSPGNHGRTTAKRRIQTNAENSYEWLMYQQLALFYRDEPRVEIVAPKSQLIYVSAYDFVLRFTHGESINFGGGVGGISIPINKAIAGWNVAHRAHVTNLGHFHQYTSLPHLSVNGSLIGHNAFAVAIRAPYEPPVQSFYLVDSRRGKCCSTPIWVDEHPEAERLPRAG